MEDSLHQDAIETQNNADLLISEKEIMSSINIVARDIKAVIGDEVPVLLCVMKGGLMFTAELMKRIQSPLELDYLHVDRYRNQTQGSSIHWRKEPDIDLQGRLVLLVDDIFDEGYTLQELIAYCSAKGASKVLSAVLLKKALAKKHTEIEPDFIGLTISDRYVFGWGMDYRSYWRNLTDIYAVSKS